MRILNRKKIGEKKGEKKEKKGEKGRKRNHTHKGFVLWHPQYRPIFPGSKTLCFSIIFFFFFFFFMKKKRKWV